MLVVVGGHSRKVGKSSVVAGLIRAIPEAEWTAIKITQHRHGGAGRKRYTLTEEAAASSGDSGRYLAAGARRSFLLDAETGSLKGAMPELRQILSGGRNTILESNTVLQFLQADLFLFVLDFSVPEFKESSRELVTRADAFVVVNEHAATPPWKAEAASWLAGKPWFRASPPHYVSEELERHVRRVLGAGMGETRFG